MAPGGTGPIAPDRARPRSPVRSHAPRGSRQKGLEPRGHGSSSPGGADAPLMRFVALGSSDADLLGAPRLYFHDLSGRGRRPCLLAPLRPSRERRFLPSLYRRHCRHGLCRDRNRGQQDLPCRRCWRHNRWPSCPHNPRGFRPPAQRTAPGGAGPASRSPHAVSRRADLFPADRAERRGRAFHGPMFRNLAPKTLVPAFHRAGATLADVAQLHAPVALERAFCQQLHPRPELPYLNLTHLRQNGCRRERAFCPSLLDRV